MMSLTRRVLALVLLSFSLYPMSASASQSYVVKPSKHAVTFNSNAPVELIEGHTDKLKGSISLSEDLNFNKDFSAEFNVDLASIDTGIALRNEHMRDNFLQTAKFPEAVFKVSKVTGDHEAFLQGKPVSVVADGSVTIHGVTLEQEVPVTVTLKRKGSKSSLIFTGKFPVRLEDYKIQRPEVVFQKLADTVFVTVSATATSN